MSFAFTLPNNYGYLLSPGLHIFDEANHRHSNVLLVATASTVLNIIHLETTAHFRKLAGVPYPNPYATAVEASKHPAALKFNSIQKAHSHFTENHPSFLITVLIAGLEYPEWATRLGAAWCVARLLFLIGYSRTNYENGKGRHLGSWWMLVQLGLTGLSFASAWKMLH